MSGTMIGERTVRIDGPAEVTGAARYPSGEPVAHPAYAFLVTGKRLRALPIRVEHLL